MYQTLQQRLKKFQSFAEKRMDFSESSPASVSVIASSSEKTEPTMMTQFIPVKEEWMALQQTLAEHPMPTYGRALHTEMHKQFRLVEVDILFLNTARQNQTRDKRQRQVCDRLKQLIDYCETGIKLSQQMDQ